MRKPVPGQFVVFDQTFTRGSGSPKAIEKPFAVLDPHTTYRMYVQPAGTAPPGISSAIVQLNQQEIFSPQDFQGSSDEEITEGVNVARQNVVRVTLQGKPGESLRVLILGDDPTAPIIRPTYAPELTEDGWSAADLTVGWVCEDPPPVSGVVSCGPQPVTVTAEGVTSVTGTAVNNAALSASITVDARVDKSDPELVLSTLPAKPAASGWFRTLPVTVIPHASDAVSGVKEVSPEVTIVEDSVKEITVKVRDRAGRDAAATITVRVDTQGPEITVNSPETATTDRVTVAGSVADATSGVARLTCNEVPVDVSGGSFECEAPLVPGLNRIVVRSWDVAGNVTRTDHLVQADYTPTVDPAIAGLIAALPSARVRSIGLGGVPQFVGGNLGTYGDPQAALAAAAPLFNLAPGELVFEELRTAPDGVRHAYYRQTKNGLDVIGGHLILHLSASGRLVAANGSAYGGPPIPAQPFLAAEEARAAALAVVPGSPGELRLCYRIATSDRRMALVYEVRVEGRTLYIHAHDGSLFELQPETAAAAPVNVYEMRPDDTELPGTLVRGPATGPSSDPMAEANYQLLVSVEAFFAQLFGLNSFDGAGSAIRSTVHFLDVPGWNGNQFLFGDGGQDFGQTADDPDVAAHEYQHAVNQYASSLQRTGEPGGLGEAFGDAAAASFDAQRHGVRSETWKIAEKSYRRGSALRHMDDPLLGSSNPDQSPWDFYPEFRSWYGSNPGCDPFTPSCSPHDIAGIGDLWFHLLAESPTGLHPRGKSETYVPRIGFLEAFRILQHANRYCLFSNARFEDARWCTAESARYSSTEDRSVPVHLAWDALSVPGSPNTSQVGVFKFGEGNGAVAEPRYRRIDCAGIDARCEAWFAPGETITLRAVPAPGYRVRWEGPCSGFGDCTFDVPDEALTFVTANFERLSDAVVTVTRSGDGLGTVTGPGIQCGTTCGVQVVPGTTITLTAAPGAGSLFRSWSGPCAGNAPTCTFQVSSDVEVGAAFDRMLGCVPPFCYTFTATVSGSAVQSCVQRTESREQTLFQPFNWVQLFPSPFTSLHRLDLNASGSTSESASVLVRRVYQWEQCRYEGVGKNERFVCYPGEVVRHMGSAGCTVQSGTGGCTSSAQLQLPYCSGAATVLSGGESGEAGTCPSGYSRCSFSCKRYEWYLDPAGSINTAELTSIRDTTHLTSLAGQPYEVRGEFDVSRDLLDLGGFHVPFFPGSGCSLSTAPSYSVASNTRHVSVTFGNDQTTTANRHEHIIARLGFCDAVDALSVGEVHLPQPGGGGSFGVTSSQVCRWTAGTSTPWIQNLLGGPRLGNGTVTFSVPENASYDERVGSIQVADKSVLVRQAPRPPYRGPALIPVHVDAPAGDNHISLRVGQLNRDGSVLRWSDPKTFAPPGHVGHVTRGADIACADLDRDGEQDCVVLHVDGPSIGNLAYLRVGYRLNGDGVATRGWTDVKPIGGGPLVYGSFLGNSQDAGLALGDVNRDGALDVVIFWVNRACRSLGRGVCEFFYEGRYRIGWGINAAGDVTGGWTPDKLLTGQLQSSFIEGVGVTLADLDRDGLLDLIPFYTRFGQHGTAAGFYQVGYGLNAAGDVTVWGPVRQVGGGFGDVNDGAGIAAGDINRNGIPDLAVFTIDDPAGENYGVYRIGWDLDANGNPTGWSGLFLVPGWFGDRDEGGGIAFVFF